MYGVLGLLFRLVLIIKLRQAINLRTLLIIGHLYNSTVGRDSSVGIATSYGLDSPGDRIQVRARLSARIQIGTVARPVSCTMSPGSFPGVKSGRGVKLTPHSLQVPWSRKGRAISLLPLWAVRPVQSLGVCTRVTFTFTFYNSSGFTSQKTRMKNLSTHCYQLFALRQRYCNKAH